MGHNTTTPGILTYSGRYVSPEAGVPALDDIAVALSRLPRFGGHTRQPWSVLDHSLFVGALAEADAAVLGEFRYDPEGAKRVVLCALLHDAHEALTGDIPTPFKTDDARALQRRLDARIMNAYIPGGALAYSAHADHIKHLDRRALLAEASTVGPRVLQTSEDMLTHFGACPDAADYVLLQAFLDKTERAAGIDSLSVRLFLHRVYGLRHGLPAAY